LCGSVLLPRLCGERVGGGGVWVGEGGGGGGGGVA